jgi:hypothetical protein
MTDSEQSEFLNNILVYLRDSSTHLTAIQMFLPILKPPSATHTSMLAAIDKLIKDGYILTIDAIVGAEYHYYISVDGTFFINRGGYIYQAKPEITSGEITVDDSTISQLLDDHLEESIFKSVADYKALINCLTEYFKSGTFPENVPTIRFKSIAKKSLGFTLTSIYREAKPNIPMDFEYLDFARKYISVFKGETMEKGTFRKSNIYKYFGSKP